MTHVAVIDFGKTNVKLAIVDPARGVEVDERRMPNRVRPGPPYPHYDTAAHWEFLLGALRDLGRRWPVAAISVTTHGATAALLDAAGGLALPILDYEFAIPAPAARAYDAIRPDFAATGSPRLGMGLNLGAQIHWQMAAFPGAGVARILTYPQYWAFRLTGVAGVEPTSLGCHTDLWEPAAGRFSALVAGQGWGRLMPPVRGAAEVLGPLQPEVAAATGLSAATPVLCGIHDSNASLYAHLIGRDPPFAVVSTGTWVVAMAVGGRAVALDPARDVLVNVDARGRPVPSARFMGGREYEMMRAGRDLHTIPAARARVLAGGAMLLPAVEPGSGPFRGRRGGWAVPPADGPEAAVALAFYLALMTAECLAMIGAAGPVVVEGPFAANGDYLDMLAAAVGRPVVAAAGGATGTAVGAALLARDVLPAAPPPAAPALPRAAPADAAGLAAQAARWRAAVAAMPAAAPG